MSKYRKDGTLKDKAVAKILDRLDGGLSQLALSNPDEDLTITHKDLTKILGDLEDVLIDRELYKIQAEGKVQAERIETEPDFGLGYLPIRVHYPQFLPNTDFMAQLEEAVRDAQEAYEQREYGTEF